MDSEMLSSHNSTTNKAFEIQESHAFKHYLYLVLLISIKFYLMQIHLLYDTLGITLATMVLVLLSYFYMFIAEIHIQSFKFASNITNLSQVVEIILGRKPRIIFDVALIFFYAQNIVVTAKYLELIFMSFLSSLFTIESYIEKFMFQVYFSVVFLFLISFMFLFRKKFLFKYSYLLSVFGCLLLISLLFLLYPSLYKELERKDLNKYNTFNLD